jgi:FHS family L-fucose permease-like MFS transporter
MSTDNKSAISSGALTRAFIVVTSLFFMWGFITVLVDFLIPRLKDVFELSYSQVILVQSAFFGAYFFLSIPAGQLLSRIGYKKGMLIGLATMGIGCLLFLPASSMRIFPLFITAYFVLAGGMTVLQVAANPYVSLLGSPESASSRLNLSQAFNSMGTTLAPIIGAIYFLSETVKSTDEIALLSETQKVDYLLAEASTVHGPFIILSIALIALAVFIGFSKLPTVLSEKETGTYAEVLSNKRLLFGAIGIFVYVGVEVSLGSFAVNYFDDMGLQSIVKANEGMMGIANFMADLFGKDMSAMDGKGILGLFVLFYWGGAMVGRFLGSYLTSVVRPALILSVFGLGAITLVLMSIYSTGLFSMWSLLFVGLFNSVMFPTIFTLGIEKLGSNKPKGSGVLCTAIVGGALIPLLIAQTIDASGFKTAFLLALVCYAYIVFYGFYASRDGQADAEIETV